MKEYPPRLLSSLFASIHYEERKQKEVKEKQKNKKYEKGRYLQTLFISIGAPRKKREIIYIESARGGWSWGRRDPNLG